MGDDRPLAIKVEAAAQLLGLSRSRVYALIAAGELPSCLVGGSRRIPMRQLEAWLDQQVKNATSPASGAELDGPRDLDTQEVQR